MREDVALFFDEHLKRDIARECIKKSKTVEADYGCIEVRLYRRVCTEKQWLMQGHQWLGLKVVIMLEYTREVRGKVETMRRFYMASFIDGPENMTQYIRNHWQVENGLPWVLIGCWMSPISRMIAAKEPKTRRPILPQSSRQQRTYCAAHPVN